ncbi:hypothetical protein [Streptomyces sp. NBC_01483]|uniref:hypothetical protein n=1 Tax=Streptomyces sp. NBC_01483 TaxID=2903883 RepID=UPI002E2EAD13|nr:hypothetical protein [Streptomyces sp. NBC_01483]
MDAGHDYATHLRTLLNLTPDTPRFSGGRDQHLNIDRTIRLAHERLQDDNPITGDDITAAGFNATLAWTLGIRNEAANGGAIEHVNNLSPWDFCDFLADLIDYNPRSIARQLRYFDELATRVRPAPETAPNVQQVHHRVTINLDTPQPFTDICGRTRNVYGLRIEYGLSPIAHRVDVTVEYKDSASLVCPVETIPDWMQAHIDQNKPVGPALQLT